MKKVDVITQIEISKSAEVVYNFASEPDNATKWYKNIKSVEWKTPKPLAIGSKIAFKAKFLGRELAYTYEIKELMLFRKLVMGTSQGPFPMETTYEFEEIGKERTKMILRNCGVASGFSAILTIFMISAMKKTNKRDLELLKEVLEKN